MQSFWHLKPFYIYNIILFLIFCLIVNSNNNFVIFYYASYSLFHFLLVYLGIYHYRKILYVIFFLYGLGLDLLWFNEIGPHLLVFMFFLIIISFFIKYLYNFNAFKIYVFLLFSILLMLFLEKFLANFMYNFKVDIFVILNFFIISLVLSYPVFLIFSKIDKIK